MSPAFVVVQAEAYLHERMPARFARLLDQVHAGLFRGAIGFACIAGDARANDVLPSGWATAVFWYHVIQIEALFLQ